MEHEQADTIPAPPVPSSNPLGEERAQAEHVRTSMVSAWVELDTHVYLLGLDQTDDYKRGFLDAMRLARNLLGEKLVAAGVPVPRKAGE